MSVENKQQLEKELHEKLMEQMGDESGALEHISQTLENISYRYFDVDSKLLEAKLKQNTRFQVCVVEALQTDLAASLKTHNKETRSLIINLAKSFTKKDSPAPLYRVGVELENIQSNGGGEYTVFSEVNCDFPHYNEETQKKICSKKSFKYDDFIDLRNNIAREIDQICDIF